MAQTPRSRADPALSNLVLQGGRSRGERRRRAGLGAWLRGVWAWLGWGR